MRLLAIDVASNFVFSGGRRIVSERDPEYAPAPRVFFAGCAGGNIALVRRDLRRSTARDVLALLALEPPWTDPAVSLRSLEEIRELLSNEAPVQAVNPTFIYILPHGLRYESDAMIVRSDSREGKRLLVRLAQEGMPRSLVEAGFRGIRDFWKPWCVALEGRDIASIAFGGRIGRLGAEVGVYTFPGFRGRGMGAAVTAAWSSMASLRGRALFYSALETNVSSQRVASRLRLRQLGAGIRIY